MKQYYQFNNAGLVFNERGTARYLDLWVRNDGMVCTSRHVTREVMNIYNEPCTIRDIEDVEVGFAVDMGMTWRWDSKGLVVVKFGDYEEIPERVVLKDNPFELFDLDFDSEF